MKKIFEYTRPSGVSLAEYASGKKYLFTLTRNGEAKELSLYEVDDNSTDERDPYLGHTVEEVLSSGRDILGEALTKDGDPEYSAVKRVMPKLTEKTYAFLGGPASWAGVTVEPDGSVVIQQSGRDREPKPVFVPTVVDERLGAITPKQMLVGKEYPVLISLHTDGVESLEFLYFVEPGDTDRDPIVWIRSKKYKNAAPECVDIAYRVGAISREGDEHLLNANPPSEEIFLDSLSDTLLYWVNYAEEGSRINLPEEELSRVCRAAMSFASLTFSGDHPHYGHKFYGKELHDNFPPNYIWTLEAAILHGREDWAKDIFSHFLKYSVSDEGRIAYRQGTGLCYGVSATEYGMLLHIANKYKKKLGISQLSGKMLKKLAGMADEIVSHCMPCPEFDGLTLVKMCAEADTNERVNVYLNNNLWAIRGLEALVSLLENTDFSTERYEKMRVLLLENTAKMIEKYSVDTERFGRLAPFRFGYTATPLTLSVCSETFRPLTEEEKASYFTTARTRGPESSAQDITENTYANYRYYPEALCSMLMPDELSDNIVKMREALGGELLGMTRFRFWVDNWPVVHYARFLIETGRIEKYLLLLYAHTAHHGRADIMAYYEQIYANGSVKAHDCVPSLLTNPIMIGWMFAYECVRGGELQLLRALPKRWYNKPFSVKGIGYSGGKLCVESDGEVMTIRFDSPAPDNTVVVWRAKDSVSLDDILIGKEKIAKIDGNRLTLKSGITEISIKIK